MTIMTRIIRLWKADFNGLMDELENRTLLIKQHMREMEEELEKKKQIVEGVNLEKAQLCQELDCYALEKESLEKDLRVAIAKKRDNIARMLIKNMVVLSRKIRDVEQRSHVLEQHGNQLKEKIQEQQVLYDQLKIRAREYLKKEERGRFDSFMQQSSPQGEKTFYEPSSEEVELELLKYKELFGVTSQEEQS